MLLTCAGKSMQKLLDKIYVQPTRNWVHNVLFMVNRTTHRSVLLLCVVQINVNKTLPIKSNKYKYAVKFFDIHASFWTEFSFPPTICPLKKKQKSKTKCILQVCYQAPGDLNQGCMLQWFQEIFNNKG